MVHLLVDPALCVWDQLQGNGVAAVQEEGSCHSPAVHEVSNSEAESRVGALFVIEVFPENREGGEEDGTERNRQAGGEAGRRAGRQVGRQAGQQERQTDGQRT